MSQSTQLQPVTVQRVEAVVNHLFPARHMHVERVLSGISTYVYHITSQGQSYYLRILPEKEASLASELVALSRLRQNHVKVPEVIYFEDYNDILGRSVMIEAEIKGLALSKSSLTCEEHARIVQEAGRDLARINSLTVEGFGWIAADHAHPQRLRAQWPTCRAFALASRQADLAYLRAHVLKAQECVLLERVLARYDFLLDSEQGYLAHGDFDTTHIFQHDGRYTGIIDFGEVRGTGPCYDLAHFRIRDGALPPYRLFPALERGYAEITPLPAGYEQRLRFTSVLINVRALTRAFQTRPPDGYIWRQLEMLHEDLAILA